MLNIFQWENKERW